MTEISEDMTKKISIPDIAIGVVIGFFLGYAVAKKTLGTISVGNSISQFNLSELNIGIRQLNNRLAIIESRLGVPSPHIPQQISDSISDSGSLSQLQQIQENEEDFTLKTNEKGRMIGFIAHRKLFSSNDE